MENLLNMVMVGLVLLAVFLYLGGCLLLAVWSHDLLKVAEVLIVLICLSINPLDLG